MKKIQNESEVIKMYNAAKGDRKKACECFGSNAFTKAVKDAKELADMCDEYIENYKIASENLQLLKASAEKWAALRHKEEMKKYLHALSPAERQALIDGE